MARQRGKRVAAPAPRSSRPQSSRPQSSRARSARARSLSGVVAVTLLAVAAGLGALNAMGSDAADDRTALTGAMRVAPTLETSPPDPAPSATTDPVPTVLAGVRFTVDKAERAKMRAEELARLRKVSTFRLATLNVLGSNHTQGKGGFGPGTARAAREADLIRSRGIDLIGLQEVQRDQRGVFTARLPGMTIWPGEALGPQGYRLQIAYDHAKFERVDQGSSVHEWLGMQVPIPWVRLRDKASRAEFYLVNVHNAPNNLQASRERSTAIEVALVNELRATGLPVLMTGDMNEKHSFFCRISAGTQMKSSNGGHWAGGCRAPGGDVKIDWLLGAGEVTFSGHVQDGTTRATGMSDHMLVYADVEVVDATGADQDGE